MARKMFFLICTQALLVKTVLSQYISSGSYINNHGLNYNNGPAPYSNNLVYNSLDVSPNSGGTFNVISSSPIAATGLSVQAELGIEGGVNVNGNLPFASAVSVDGNLPANGQAAINYGCGSDVGLSARGPGVGLTGAGNGQGVAFSPRQGLVIGAGQGLGIGAGQGLGIGAGQGLGIGAGQGLGIDAGQGFGIGASQSTTAAGNSIGAGRLA